MQENTAEPEPLVNWRKIHAFGWPAGSVRAVMALVVFGAIWALLVLRPDLEVPEYLKDLLFIILGHYFAVRGRTGADGEPGPPPLFLPNGSVRLLLIAGFVASAVLLYREGRLLAIDRNPAVVTLLLAFGFLLGVVLRLVAGWLGGGRPHLPRFVEDARALISVGAAVLLVAVVWDTYLPHSPGWGLSEIKLGLGRIGLPHVSAAVVGFYFGSRS
ncbi:MAG: hypothetical protein NVSMB9_19680 [Isosphaeraceae bacterium]